MNTQTLRRKKHPTADAMRAQLVLAADEIIRLRGVIEAICRAQNMKVYEDGKRPMFSDLDPQSWWRRILRRRS